MTDQRPQYGELATPEEQRRLAGLPPLEASVEPEAPVEASVKPVHQRTTDLPASPRAPAKPWRWDRPITIALLAYGLINVFMTGISYLDLSRVMNESMKIIGIPGEFTNFEAAKLWGTIAAVLLVIGWMITAWLSVRRLRSGKRAWWIPLVGAAATMVIVGICITVPIMGDAAFLSYVDGISG